MIELHRTYYLGCDYDGTHANIGQSETIRLCNHTAHPTCAQVDLLSAAFLKAQMLWQDKAITSPFRIAIIVARHHTRKFKPTDADRTIHRIEWLVKNFVPPSCGAIVSFYISDEMEAWIDGGFSTHALWKTKQQWIGDGDYVTLQTPEGLSDSGNNWKQKNIQKLIESVRLNAIAHNLKVKYIDYTMSYDTVSELLMHTKKHFSYIGASYFIAALMRTPTVGLGLDKEKRKISIPTGPGVEKQDEIYMNIFTSSQPDPGHVKQIDDNMRVINSPVTTVYHTTSEIDIDNEFDGLIK